MNELEAREAIARGAHAKRILEDDMVTMAIAMMRADAYAKIETTGAGEKDKRESLYMYLKAISNFEAQFQYAIEEGKVASNWLENHIANKRAAKRRPR